MRSGKRLKLRLWRSFNAVHFRRKYYRCWLKRVRIYPSIKDNSQIKITQVKDAILGITSRHPPHTTFEKVRFERHTFSSRLAALWFWNGTDHHNHLTTFHFWHVLDLTRFIFRDGFCHTIQKFRTQALVCHFATTETQGDFDFIAVV